MYVLSFNYQDVVILIIISMLCAYEIHACTCKFERNNGIIPTLHHERRGQSWNKLYNYTLIKDSVLRWCHTVSICTFTHVIRRNIMKSTLVHVSVIEITVSFQLCTMKDGGGGQSRNKLYM